MSRRAWTTWTPTTPRWPTPRVQDGRVFLADAEVDGVRCLRVCFVNFRTRTEDVTFALDTLRALGRDLA